MHPASEPVALDARGRACALIAAAACLLPLLLQLPKPLAATIAVVGIALFVACRDRAPPAPVRLAASVAVLGAVLAYAHFRFGRDTGCALLAAMLAIKSMETFSLRDARSLVGFALFAPFATFLLDQGPWSLLLGLGACVIALYTLAYLADLQARLPVIQTTPRARLWQVLRLMALGLPLALAMFWLFPRLASPLWGVPERAMGRPGLSDSMTPDQWLDLMSDDTPALRAQFFGATPAPSQRYWRGPVLWTFDGATWTRPRGMLAGPPQPVSAGPVRWDYALELEPTDRRQLVALDVPVAAPDGALLSFDYDLQTARPLDAVTRWRLRSAPPRAFDPVLPPMLRHLALQLPDGYNPRTRALAAQWRRAAGADDAAIVRRALDMIRADFAYTLEVPPPTHDSIDQFLFTTRAGFCQHFSSAFVVLMRAAGIPARVVTGYAGGYRNPIGDYWLVRRSDAHAWAEVWLPPRGWVRVDPTAAVAPERVYDTLADRAPGTFGAFAGLTPVFDVGDWMRRGWNDFVLGFDANRQRQLLRPFGVPDLDPSRLALLFVLALAAALAWMLWLAGRADRERDPVLQAWHGLGKRYARLGLARAAHESAGDWAVRVAAARPAASGLSALSARFAQWRYAPAQGRDERSTQATRNALVRDLRAHRP